MATKISIPTSKTRPAIAVILLAVGSPALCADMDFSRVVVDAQPPERPWSKMLGDITGDGQLDIVVAGARGPLVYYRYPDWKREELAPSGWDGVNGEVGDVDGDGDADIVLGGVVWYSNPRVGGGGWRKVRIDQRQAHDIELGDLNGDGRLDVVARNQSAFGRDGNTIHVYIQESPSAWKRHSVPCPHGEGLKLADLDRDGDLDIVYAGGWFENTGVPTDWTKRRYTQGWQEPDAKVEVADVNGDSRADVVLTPAELKGERYKVAWYEAPRDALKDAWREHVVVDDIEAVIHSLAVGDFDRDGDVDLAFAEMHQGTDPDEVCVYHNLDRGRRWRKQVLSKEGSHDIVAGDIDGDRDLDLVGANHGGSPHPVELWRNRGPLK